MTYPFKMRGRGGERREGGRGEEGKGSKGDVLEGKGGMEERGAYMH